MFDLWDSRQTPIKIRLDVKTTDVTQLIKKLVKTVIAYKVLKRKKASTKQVS